MIYPLPNEGKNKKKTKTVKLNENVNTRAGMKLILNAVSNFDKLGKSSVNLSIQD